MTAAPIGTLFGGGDLLSIDRIRRDPRTQPRNHINHEVVERYRDAMEAGDALPPVTVFFDGTDYWLADGWHRVCAALCLGWQGIAAEVLPGGLREAEWHSFSVNATHGYPRGKDDVGRILRRVFEDPVWSTKGLREISRHCAIPKSTVHDHYRKITSSVRAGQVGIKPSMREVERGGKVFEQETLNIGRPSAPEQSYDARHRWTHEDIADYASRNRVDENGQPVEADDEDDEVDGPQSCASCRFMKWHDSFQAWECGVYRKETGPDNIVGYSCPSWEEEPPEVPRKPPPRDPNSPYQAYPPEHGQPATMIRELVRMLYQQLNLTPAQALVVSRWAGLEGYRTEAHAVSAWLAALVAELPEEELEL